MDDLTVLDGDCEEIIKQGRFSKCKPQNNHSFIPRALLAKLLLIQERQFVFQLQYVYNISLQQ